MDQVEDNLKVLEGMNSMYPKMDIKPLGGGTKSQNKISRSSSFSNSDAVQEEDRDVIDADDLGQQMTKSKFKHVNIMTDSDEFNQHKISDSMTSSQNATSQLQRIRSTSGDAPYGDSIQEDKIEDENDSSSKMITSKLGISTHSIEESILLDKGEFDCSTPTRPKGTALLKKINSSTTYSQYNQKEEIITEDPEKETEGNNVTRISSHKEIKIKVDEIDNEKSKSFTPRINYMDHSVPIIEETKEEDLLEGNKQLQTAKQEREQEKGYLKKLVKGDTIHQGEKLVHMAETSGITSHMPGAQIKENQNDEDVGDNEEEENVAEEYQKRRRSSLNVVDSNFTKNIEEEQNGVDEEDEDDD